MYARDYFLKRGVDPVPVENLCRLLLSANLQYLVWEFHKAPEVLQKLCDLNGGDEDWLVLCRNTEDTEWCSWLERMGETDEYLLDGIRIFVGSHA
jgi:hypothetical protein